MVYMYVLLWLVLVLKVIGGTATSRVYLGEYNSRPESRADICGVILHWDTAVSKHLAREGCRAVLLLLYLVDKPPRFVGFEQASSHTSHQLQTIMSDAAQEFGLSRAWRATVKNVGEREVVLALAIFLPLGALLLGYCGGTCASNRYAGCVCCEDNKYTCKHANTQHTYTRTYVQEEQQRVGRRLLVDLLLTVVYSYQVHVIPGMMYL